MGTESEAMTTKTRIPDGTPVMYWADTGPVQLVIEDGAVVRAELVDNEEAPAYVYAE